MKPCQSVLIAVSYTHLDVYKRQLQYRPQLVKAKLLAGATDPISGGYDKVGLGGIDFASAQWSGHWYWWSGGTNAFNTFDAQDGATDGYVVKTLFVSNSWDKVRVVLSWLTRGTYTYDHRADAHPIGLDLDLSVYDPNGGYDKVGLGCLLYTSRCV